MDKWSDIKDIAGWIASGALASVSAFLGVVAIMFGAMVFMTLGEYGLADGWKMALMAFVLMAGTGGVSYALYMIADWIA